jgi:hypothetical protein
MDLRDNARKKNAHSLVNWLRSERTSAVLVHPEAMFDFLYLTAFSAALPPPHFSFWLAELRKGESVYG